jgi:hypothetical protein
MTAVPPVPPPRSEPSTLCTCDNCPEGCTCDTCQCEDCTCDTCSHSA